MSNKTKITGIRLNGWGILALVSEQSGYMNINNQLGINSNVGKVDKAATTTAMDGYNVLDFNCC